MARIMITEDDNLIRERLKKLLELSDHSVITAEDGKQGLELFLKEKPEIAVVDIKMPKMDGIELLTRMKATPGKTEVIMCTGHANVETAVEALKLGAFDYIFKPIEFDELEIIINKALEKQAVKKQLDQYLISLEAAIEEKNHEIGRRKQAEKKEQELAVKAAKAEAKKKQMEELNKAYENLEKTNKKLKNTQLQLVHTGQLSALGQLSSGISHELNQPLQTISIIRSSIQKRLKKLNVVDDKIDIYNKDLKFAINRMKMIIQHVKYFARQEKGEFELININDSIENSLILIKQQVKNRDIQLNMDLQEDMPKTIGDLRQIEQVSINMISNAIDAIGEGGKITINSFVKDNNIYIKWKNNGPPIDDEIIKTIFNPFFTTKEEGKGTGLGLSISHGIVQEHKGTLSVKSDENETVFTMTIPVTELPDYE